MHNPRLMSKATLLKDTLMKRIPLMLAAPVWVLAGLFATAGAEELADERARLSYVIGLDVARSIKGLDVDVDLDAMMRAMQDVIADREPAIDAVAAEEIKQAFFAARQAEAMAEAQQVAAANLERSREFLTTNAGREGVEQTESGLQYEVLETGDGPKPTADDRVSVHYRGTLTDGTEFDSSYNRGEPTTFPLSGVIPGWTEGLQLMPVGSKYRFVLPPELAYGENGAGGVIGPNEALVFEVELLEIVRP